MTQTGYIWRMYHSLTQSNLRLVVPNLPIFLDVDEYFDGQLLVS